MTRWRTSRDNLQAGIIRYSLGPLAPTSQGWGCHSHPIPLTNLTIHSSPAVLPSRPMTSGWAGDHCPLSFRCHDLNVYALAVAAVAATG
jgi:hypothetical protein